MKALELKAINYLTYNKDLEYTPTHIFSLLFVEDILIPKFDIDVLYAIQDKRILAYCLNRLIAEDVIRFKIDVRLPEYFDTNRHHSSTNRIRTKRPEAITTFDKIYTVKD